METNMNHQLVAGTLGGTLLTITGNLQATFAQTVMVAAIGAAVSFIVSLCLRKLAKWLGL